MEMSMRAAKFECHSINIVRAGSGPGRPTLRLERSQSYADRQEGRPPQTGQVPSSIPDLHHMQSVRTLSTATSYNTLTTTR